uniref:Tetratricopeptide repeat domain 16 n=1 Tax=Molossus molossus TaxID=27622 RepID=A0A7J8EHE1_MOLMO|nr:tetratricopeptide repeat domain 16 [Molossus molossus]
MTDSSEDAPKLGPRPSQHIPKPQGTPLPKKILQRIFGTSQAFRSFDEIRPTVTGLTVPLKVREYASHPLTHKPQLYALGWSKSEPVPLPLSPVPTATTEDMSAWSKKTGSWLCCSSPVPSTWTPSW